ncbi:Short C-terminal domain-containing protein [Pseudoxanthomonas sp. GM95]|uniref:PH domain-containing protein n=1 Tax=Pseudoxanthomonas sp. GM95 TaxID=1881043 RepID=UPI0008BE37F9|nr:PH domain-containing protein [Pseudoxanthomonas sp. GM95]SEM35574.1 Short C-terminal domain-containing protein [Pseudoxanthomonas sp. GM95]
MRPIAELLSDEQDEAAVTKLLPKIQQLLSADETVDYIAVQKKLVVNISPDAIVLTSRRLIIVRPRLMGMDFQDFPWREVADVHMSEQMVGATIVCKTVDGQAIQVDSLPKRQARRVYAYAQGVEEQAYEKRRQVELEKLRASAGGVVLHAPAPGTPPAPAASAADDPMQVLGKLKQLLDAGLISQGEYDAKKAEVLGRM